MHTLYLPYLTKDDTLDQAKTRMKDSDSRAVVVDLLNTAFMLYMNFDVRDALRLGKNLLSEIPDTAGHPVMVLGSPTPQQFQPPFHTPSPIIFHGDLEIYLENQLDAHGVSYGLLFPPSSPQTSGTQPSALVVTRHEGLRDDIIKTNKVCACDMNKKHDAESPPTNDGDPCEICDGKYECY